MLQCFGLVYMKITGPFWNLITKSGVSFLQLNQPVQDIHAFLENCKKNPSIILRSDIHWTEDNTNEILNLPYRNRMVECQFIVHEDTRNELFSWIKAVTSTMNQTTEKQLADFLSGGKFGEPPSDKDINHTRYAQTTNLGCEHHFGNLDHSQRRRPSTSMHHHSSVQLLKHNRFRMMKWLQDMPFDDRHNLMKAVQKGGKTLCKKHLNKSWC